MATNIHAEATAFFRDLVHVETRLYNALDEHLRERHGIVTSQLWFLQHVRDHPGTRVVDLANEFVAGVGAASKAVDRHERHGWLRRVPNPADRRSSVLELTGTGRELLDAAEVSCGDRLAELLGGRDVGAAAGLLADLRATLGRDGVGTPAG
ncbi:MarR family winged helix-turn-helix transcriptional regulator [Kineococcus rhizosphaerae]|uniref:DNA-binding MarR family transcriptional regulator n=1 Tax=Kineococcus rhizosphaerae TaxID=559628 RepID=A0A2T0R0G2_9ACTN|nr:MarR family winged helix-turn-helix transcriptional regulator [Kineococcus rhizosphaerae]PRY12621.1 DNA-binding MarR family transcriptional regulator [Kineococcus rhizosphaerae]